MDEVNCFALVPKSWPSSGQSIPSNRTFTAFPFFITNIVSPSPMPTHLPLNVLANVHDADIVKNKDKYRLMAFFLKSDDERQALFSVQRQLFFPRIDSLLLLPK
jgi:hypothetical protein